MGITEARKSAKFSISIFKIESLEKVFRGNRCHEKQKLGIVEQDFYTGAVILNAEKYDFFTNIN